MIEFELVCQPTAFVVGTSKTDDGQTLLVRGDSLKRDY